MKVRSSRWLLAFLACCATLHAAASAAGAEAVAWYRGEVADALASARAQGKPVIVYWGAGWCPPCLQLKAFVFTRRDFIEKSRQFVAIALDGDDPGAQRWAETFHVVGYPTVVVLRPDGREITRIAGSTDLSQYAGLLDAALNDLKPIEAVVAILREHPAALLAGDCRRLAYFAWASGDYLVGDSASLASAIASAAHSCAGLTRLERARLTLAAAAFDPAPPVTAEAIAIVHDISLALQLGDALQGLREPFFAAVVARGPAVSAQVREDWIRVMDRIAADRSLTEADRLNAIGMKLAVARSLSPEHKLPAELATDARGRVEAALGRRSDPYVRAGLVDTATFVYQGLDDVDAIYAMVRAEVDTARAPDYYMDELGDIEETRGHAAEAIAWHERAYREAHGVATRFQWGVNYLACLVRLAPTDHARIRDVGMQVLAELDGPDRILARTRMRLERLDARLRKWNADHRYDADIQELRARMEAVCARLPSSDGGLGSCRRFLS